MNRRHLTAVFILAACLSACSKVEYIIEKQDQQTVKVDTLLVPIIFSIKSSSGGFGGEWVGKIDLVVYERYMNGEINSKMLTFYDVYFIDNKGNKIKNSDTKHANGQLFGYSDTVNIRSDVIIRTMTGYTTTVVNGKTEIKYNVGIYDFSTNGK